MRAGILASLVAIAACGKHADRVAPKPAPPGPIDVPRPRAAIPIDGEWEADWNDRAARVVFHVRGGDGEARPYSEMRVLRDGDALLVGLYAADEEIHSNEFFDVQIGALHAHATAGGTLVPAIDGAKVGLDVDGTPDHPGDYDEEWKLEISIPIAALGAPSPDGIFPAHVSRCDTPKDGIERCGAWDGQLRLR
jgi:hypothetical protein